MVPHNNVCVIVVGDRAGDAYRVTLITLGWWDNTPPRTIFKSGFLDNGEGVLNTTSDASVSPSRRNLLFKATIFVVRAALNPFRTAVPFWGQTSQISSSFVPKRDRGSKGVKACLGGNRVWNSSQGCLRCLILTIVYGRLWYFLADSQFAPMESVQQ